MSAYDIFGSVPLLPVGTMIAGPLASTFGLRATLLAGASFVVLSCLGSIAVRDVHSLPEAPAPASMPSTASDITAKVR